MSIVFGSWNVWKGDAQQSHPQRQLFRYGFAFSTKLRVLAALCILKKTSQGIIMSDDFDFEKFFHDNDVKVHQLSEQIPKVNDVTLVVIKGHLVVERCLYSILSANMNYPKYLEEAKLSFAQLLNLVKATSKLPLHQETFDGIKKLNSLRNHLAHNLPNQETYKKIECFINSVGIKIEGHTSHAQQIWDQVYSLLGSISILISVEELLCTGKDKVGILDVIKKIAMRS
jgi:hypothetical protein